MEPAGKALRHGPGPYCSRGGDRVWLHFRPGNARSDPLPAMKGGEKNGRKGLSGRDAEHGQDKKIDTGLNRG